MHATLELLAAYQLQSADPRFGGFSAIETDGTTLWLLSDRATLWQARLGPAAALGDLGLDDWRAGAVRGDDLDRGDLDSEALARLPDGTLVAAFEHDDSLRRLVPDGDDWRTERLHAGRLISGAPPNRGLEALTALADGALLALLEEVRGSPGQAAGAMLAADGITTFTYQPGRGFNPVAAATGTDGLFVLERSIGLLTGWRSRLTRLPAVRPAAGTQLTGEELLRITAGPLAENYEGVAVLALPGAAPLVLLVADDNHSALQRTLLLVIRHAG